MITNADMTIYHKYINAETRLDAYKRQPVYGVLWEERKGVNVIESGLKDADKVAVYVALENMEGVQIAPGDIMVRGICEKDVSADYTAAALQREYSSAVITSVDKLDFGSGELQHYDIRGV